MKIGKIEVSPNERQVLLQALSFFMNDAKETMNSAEDEQETQVADESEQDFITAGQLYSRVKDLTF
jgi:hypothetical protein